VRVCQSYVNKACTYSEISNSSLASWSLLLVLDHLIGSLVVLALSLLDEVGDGLLQVVNAPAHLIDAPDDVVAHGLEAGLHLGEHILDQLGQLVGRVVPSPRGH